MKSHGGKRQNSGRKKGLPGTGREAKSHYIRSIKKTGKTYQDYIKEEANKKGSDPIYKLFYRFGKKVM